VRHLAREFLHDREHLVHDAAAERVAPRVHAVEHQWAAAWTTRQARERALAAGAPSAAQQLVQAGLFDQRAMRASAARSRAAAVLLEDAGQRRSSLASATLTASLDLRAILIVPNRASS
jgi:cysteine synthase